MSLFARFVGVLTSPRQTFENVVPFPKWFGMYVLTAVIMAVGAALPLTTPAGKQAAVDQQVSATEAFGIEVSDAQYDAMVKGADILPYTTGGTVLIVGILMALLMAAILWAIFNAAMGGDARYKQILAVLIHANVISAVSALFSGLINYVRGGAGSATSLTSLLPMLDDKSFAGRLAGAVDVFLIWWVLVLAVGLAVLYRRKTQPIAITLFAIYAVIAVTIAAVMS
jgi:hypothetical protein